MLNLDTHILLFALVGKLRPVERDLLAGSNWGISSIVLWELAALAARGRIELDLEDREFRRVLGQLQVWPIGLEVALASTRLDFQADPADHLIGATSVVHRVPLVTRDRAIRKSAVVPLA